MLCDFNRWIRPQSWDWPKALGHQSVLLFKLSAISWHCIHPGCWLLLIPPWQQPPGRHPIIDTHSWLKIGCCKALAPLWHVQQRQRLSLFVTGADGVWQGLRLARLELPDQSAKCHYCGHLAGQVTGEIIQGWRRWVGHFAGSPQHIYAVTP